MAVGLAVCWLVGYSGGGADEAGAGGRGLVGGRAGGGMTTARFEDLLGWSMGELAGGTGERGPLAVFALLLWPPGEEAER